MWGLIPGRDHFKQAAARGKYPLTVQSSGDKMPFEDASFQTVISNSVLEHIPDLDAVLLETARVLKPGGMFIFASPIISS